MGRIGLLLTWVVLALSACSGSPSPSGPEYFEERHLAISGLGYGYSEGMPELTIKGWISNWGGQPLAGIWVESVCYDAAGNLIETRRVTVIPDALDPDRSDDPGASAMFETTVPGHAKRVVLTPHCDLGSGSAKRIYYP